MIRLYCQNIRGLKSKLYDIFLLIKTHHPDILALQETYLSDKDTLDIPGYKFFKSVRRPNQKGGGVVLLIKVNLDPYMVNNSNILEYQNTEFITVSILFKKDSRLNITSIYIPPSKRVDMKELTSSIILQR